MSTPTPNNTPMPNVWSPLLYNITKKILSIKFSSNPTLSKLNINLDCIVSNLVKTFPNPNNADQTTVEQIIVNCWKNPTPTQPALPFDTNISSSWNKQLISNLRDILPDTFNIPSNLDLDCLVNSFIKKFPNPNDLIDYLVKTQNDNQNNTNPEIPSDLVSYCDLQAIKKRRNNKYLMMIGVALLIAGIIAFFMWKRKSSLSPSFSRPYIR